VSRLGWLLYRARWPLAVLVGTLIFTRWLTVPGVQPADSGEFQLVARELGIAHPPGYALYTMAAHGWGELVTRAPVGRLLGADPALWTAHRPLDADPWTWATNAFSALLAVLTLGLVYRTGYLLTRARAGGVAAALVLLLVPTFLIQGAIANIRMPTALFTALLIYLTCRWLADEAERPPDVAAPAPDWRLAALALVAGLAAGHHGSLALVAFTAAVVVVARRPRVLRDGRTLAAVLGALALSLLPQLYLPVRDFQHALFAEGHLRTLAGVVNHVTAADFRGDVVSLAATNTLRDRGGVLANVFWLQFGPLWLLAGVAGFVWLARWHRGAAVLLAGIVGVTAAVSIVYKAPQTVEYLMPAYVALSVATGAAVGALWRRIRAGQFVVALWQRNRSGQVVVGLGIAATALALWASVAALPVGQRSVSADGWLLNVFDHAVTPDHMTILAAWHYAMPLLYAQRHLVDRPDVKVQYVYPEGSEAIGATWLRRLRDTSGPVLLTNRPREIADAEISLWPAPETPFYLNVPPPGGYGLESPADPVTFGDSIRLLGFGIESHPPGNGRPILVALSALHPISETLTATVQIDGGMVGQADVAIPAWRWNDPRGVVIRLPMFLQHPREGGEYRLGLYRNTPNGPGRLRVGQADDVSIGGYSVPSGGAPWYVPGPAGSIPFGNVAHLTASAIHRVGNELLVDLTWRADEAAARSDYTVSVQAHGDTWQAQDDGTPAMGAIPTLKWLPGQVIHDRHRIQLPADLAADAPFHVSVGVYDAFSLEPLPVTDAERVKQGQGQAAEVWRQGD
jgi:hypothetical protein